MSYSHLVPLVLPVAESAQRAGHDVRVATGAGMADAVEKRGLPVLALPNVASIAAALTKDNAAFEKLHSQVGSVTVELDPHFFASVFAGRMAGVFARDLLDAADEFTPDLVLRESTEFGGRLA